MTHRPVPDDVLASIVDEVVLPLVRPDAPEPGRPATNSAGGRAPDGGATDVRPA